MKAMLKKWGHVIIVGMLAGYIGLHNLEVKSAESGQETGAEVITEDFTKPIDVQDGKRFGSKGQLTFELFRDGAFLIDGKSGIAWQKSDSYRDSAIIRSTDALPDVYKISVVVGDIDYDLEYVDGLPQDPQYTEGPKNENGCYLIAITDEPPVDYYTNDWWHKHRKVVIDVDNNKWGHGMPHPVFMVYFDKENELMAFDGQYNRWQDEWNGAVRYQKGQWYRIELEKTASQFVFRILEENGGVLKEARVSRDKVWHEDSVHPDYFVIGDPHINYYQGSMKIKSIGMTI